MRDARPVSSITQAVRRRAMSPSAGGVVDGTGGAFDGDFAAAPGTALAVGGVSAGAAFSSRIRLRKPNCSTSVRSFSGSS